MNITPATPRAEVQVRFPDGRAFDGPSGTTVEAFINVAQPKGEGQIVASLVNGHLRELSHVLQQDADLVPITVADSDGSRIYRRSLSFLVIAAAAEVLPGRNVIVNHSMPFGGYYCQCEDDHEDLYHLSDAELRRLETRMRQLVAEDLPIKQVKVPLEQAIQIFKDAGDLDKAELFAKRRKDYLTLYELNSVRDYFHGFMVPRSSYLKLFALRQYADGFIFQFPRRHDPEQLQPFEDEPRLARVFRDYNDWLSLIDVPSVAALNRAIATDRAQEIILVAEAIHERQLTHIADQIAERRPQMKVILISGPTSSGKTTFSKRLAIQMMARGIQPVAIPMDNYFVNREETPRDESGEYDFESLEAVDMALLRRHLRQLLDGESIVQPIFDFRTGQRQWGDELQVDPDHVIILEGIHGLNPRLIEGVPLSSVYRVFISALTQLNLDQHNRVPTTDTRMLRRIVRDAARRGYSAADTIKRWPSVRRGERRYIFPHQNNADYFFNSALVYELAVLKPLAQPLLLQVEPGTAQRVEANRLLAFLQWFDPIDISGQVRIPSDSILREFIGRSILGDFEPWQRS